MKNMCSECFIKYIDPCATTNRIVEGCIDNRCDGCGKYKKIVVSYAKYGE